MKLKTVYNCEKCGYQSQKWIGKCPECDEWNTFIEDVVSKDEIRAHRDIRSLDPAPFSHTLEIKERMSTQIEECDRVLGGGIVRGSLTLLTGEPGIGKSTLTLQICNAIAIQSKKVFYFSGEESEEQIAMRARRFGITSEHIHLITENNLEVILATIREKKPDFVIIDSIQVIQSESIPSNGGSMTQIRYCGESIMRTIKELGIPTILIGHVTKDGTLAGPRTLEHLVDTVLYLEGERYQHLRLLRGVKNRFGSTNEIGVFEMDEKGLKEITNPSKIFLEGRAENAVGSVITCTIEGTRPFLVEVQALSTISTFGFPKRSATGFNLNRLQMIIAVLQEHGKLNLTNQDIYINVVGGMKIEEPAGDLAVALAIYSAFKKKPLPHDLVVFGEIGLSGELRNVTQLERRIKEAKKLGFEKVITPKQTKTIAQAVQNLSHPE